MCRIRYVRDVRYVHVRRTLAFARRLVGSFYRRRPFRHASDDRASDARVDRRGGAGASFASFAFAAGFFFAVDFAAGLSLAFPSLAVFSAGRGVFRGLPTGRFAVKGFSAVAWIASRGGRIAAGVSASGEAAVARADARRAAGVSSGADWPRFGFAAGVRRARGVSSGSSGGDSAFFFFSVLAPARGVARSGSRDVRDERSNTARVSEVTSHVT